MHGYGIGPVFATISTLGLDLDLSKQRVLMCMHNGARRRAVALARGWPEPVMGWMRAQGTQARLQRGSGDSDGRKKKANVVNPTRANLFIAGSTRSAHCGSFHRTVPTTMDLFR
jgi:hypothetical protein